MSFVADSGGGWDSSAPGGWNEAPADDTWGQKDASDKFGGDDAGLGYVRLMDGFIPFEPP